MYAAPRAHPSHDRQHHRQPASHQDEHRRHRLIVCRHASTTGHHQSRETGGPGHGSRRQPDKRHAPGATAPHQSAPEAAGDAPQVQQVPHHCPAPRRTPQDTTDPAAQHPMPTRQSTSTAEPHRRPEEAAGQHQDRQKVPGTSQRPEAQHKTPQAQPEPSELHSGTGRRERPAPSTRRISRAPQSATAWAPEAPEAGEDRPRTWGHHERYTGGRVCAK